MKRPEVPWFPLLLAVVCGALAVLSIDEGRWHDLFDYRRDAIADGQSWRLVSAHVMHLSVAHAVLDLAGLLLVAWIFDAELTARHQVFTCLVGAATIDASLWMLHPEVDRYVGLSGLLHAWFAAGATRWLLASPHESGGDLVGRKRLWGAALLIGLAIKLALEARHEAFWLTGWSFPVVTAAHRWGGVAGCAVGALVAWFSRRDARVDAGRASRGR